MKPYLGHELAQASTRLAEAIGVFCLRIGVEPVEMRVRQFEFKLHPNIEVPIGTQEVPVLNEKDLSHALNPFKLWECDANERADPQHVAIPR